MEEKQYLLGLGHREVNHIAPGATLEVRGQVQFPCRIEAFVIAPEQGDLLLQHLQIGPYCYTANTSAVPLRAFAQRHGTAPGLSYLHALEHSLWSPLELTEQRREGRLSDVAIPRPLLELGPALAGTEIMARITNEGREPAPGRLVLLVRTCQLYEHNINGRRRVEAYPPAVCGVCDSVLEQLGGGHYTSDAPINWCALCGSVNVGGALRPSAFSLVAPEERLERVREEVKRSRGF